MQQFDKIKGCLIKYQIGYKGISLRNDYIDLSKTKSLSDLFTTFMIFENSNKR